MREVYVLAHNIRSLYNVGALFRLCDGVGVTKLYLSGYTGAPFPRVKYTRQRSQIAKTALEGLDNVDWEYHDDPLKVVDIMKKAGVSIISLEQTSSSQNYTEAIYPEKVCLILGNETDGVAEELLNVSDRHIELPMAGVGKSLNVITATAVALFHIQYESLV